MQRLIVTSATYRQSSQVTPELLEKDPENRLLARGPRFRLPAEMVRDNALAVERAAGRNASAARACFRISRKGLWEEMAYRRRVLRAELYARATARTSTAAACTRSGSARAPPPALITFDAPDREKCTARRGGDQYAAAGAGAAERSDLRGGGARAGAARDRSKAARDPGAPHRAMLSGWPRRASPTREEMRRAREARSARTRRITAAIPRAARKLLGVGEIASRRSQARSRANWPPGPRWPARS